MPRTGSWLRVFVALLLAVIPPIVVLALVVFATDRLVQLIGSELLAVAVLGAVVAWPAILAVFYTRMLADDYRSMLALAARGEIRPEAASGAAMTQLAGALEERNQQVSTLAHMAALVPIEDDPGRVARALLAMARSVMGDPTWRLAVLPSDESPTLVPGIYHGDDPPDVATDLEQWASTSIGDSPAARADGPWGAFVVVRVSSTDRLRAILYAPWEGRADPTPAEIDVLTLMGQHAATALDHALLYARVRAQADELHRLAGVQADFLRGVTHDLQTPLTSIGALATELGANGQVPDSARADLDSISYQADRLRRMVSQLLVASRLEAGVLEPQQDVFAVQPLIERTWAALRADRPFELEVDGPAHLAVADPDRLEQVLWAVFDNAVKYSPSGSPISAAISSAHESLEIKVADKGTGMDVETQKSAFDQFYRSGQARKLAPDGSGVGLYAARGIMTAMGGSIDVASQLGSGTAVTIRVPAEPSEGAD